MQRPQTRARGSGSPLDTLTPLFGSSFAELGENIMQHLPKEDVRKLTGVNRTFRNFQGSGEGVAIVSNHRSTPRQPEQLGTYRTRAIIESERERRAHNAKNKEDFQHGYTYDTGYSLHGANMDVVARGTPEEERRHESHWSRVRRHMRRQHRARTGETLQPYPET